MRFILLSVLAITICSCKTKKSDTVNFNKPESVVRAYYKAFSELDFTKAAEYSTEESKPIMNMMDQMMAMMEADTLTAIKAQAKEANKNVKTVTCTDAENGMKTCTVCCDPAGKAFEAPILVKKENGKWLVHTPKEMPIDGEAVPEEPVGN